MCEPCIDGLEGLSWYPNGQSALSGHLLALYQALDDYLVREATDQGAEAHAFPSFIPARELAKVDYLHAFPHHATFAVGLVNDEANLAAFAEANETERDAWTLTEVEPVRDILTPAACYHFYIGLQGRRIDGPRLLTTRCTCHRREAAYLPLQRQWSFNMREWVCLGDEASVDGFLSDGQRRAKALAEALGIEARWQQATDPFFRPEANPRYLAQKILPVKQELVLDDGLAIASVNRHGDHFGRAFEIDHAGAPAHSDCVAFGLERWLYALAQAFDGDMAAAVEAVRGLREAA